MPALGDALALAANAHKFQLYNRQPYIFHIVEVVRALPSNATEDMKIVAALHDILEDTRIRIEHLRSMGYSDDVIVAVDAMTKRDREAYRTYILRLRENPIACVVKLADVSCNLARLSELGDVDRRGRLERKYTMALQLLLEDTAS